MAPPRARGGLKEFTGRDASTTIFWARAATSDATTQKPIIGTRHRTSAGMKASSDLESWKGKCIRGTTWRTTAAGIAAIMHIRDNRRYTLKTAWEAPRQPLATSLS